MSRRTSFLRSLRNVSAALRGLKRTPTKTNDDVTMRRALLKQNQQAKITSRAIDRIRGGSDL